MRSAPNRTSWIVTGVLLLAVIGACIMADVVTSPAELAGWVSWLGDDVSIFGGWRVHPVARHAPHSPNTSTTWAGSE